VVPAFFSRERMQRRYDFSKYTWVLNEVTSAVRTDTGQARANCASVAWPVRRRRHPPDAWSRFHHGPRSADEHSRPVSDEPAELALRLGLLGGHVDLCQRLVAGGLRRRSQLGRSRRRHGHASRLPHRLPAAPARARRRRAADDRHRSRVSPDRIQPARERRVGARHGVRLDDGAGGADGRLRVGGGLLLGTSAPRPGRRPTTGGSRGRHGTDRARPRGTSRRRPGRSWTGSQRRSTTPLRPTRRIPGAPPAGFRARTSASATSTALGSMPRGRPSASGRSRCSPSRRRPRRFRPGRRRWPCG
jgi:hypothetical protein